jgi:hypothetical protein
MMTQHSCATTGGDSNPGTCKECIVDCFHPFLLHPTSSAHKYQTPTVDVTCSMELSWHFMGNIKENNKTSTRAMDY